MEASVTLKNVSKHFKKKYALSNLTLGIEKGSTFAVIGKSGAGKSTLLRVLATLLEPDHGTVYINGKSTAEFRMLSNRALGYLPDHDMHDPWKTGLENLQVRARFLGIDEQKIESVLQPLIEKFNLTEEIHDFPVTYSRGLKRCLDIVQVLMGDPEILLLDEPTLGLDYTSRNALYSYLHEVKGRKTIAIASNIFTELQLLADRWVVLHLGQIRFDGAMEKLISQINVPFVGVIEFRQENRAAIDALKRGKSVVKIIEFGKSVQIITESFDAFYQNVKKIDPEEIVSLSGSSLNIDNFLDQLLSDEGF